MPHNRFYQRKFGKEHLQLSSLTELAHLPYTTKQELVASQAAHGLSDHHTYAAQDYCRVHRTSGTHGSPLLVMDTSTDWQWWADTWQHVLTAAEVTDNDRVFMAFSFGPFIGFWSAHEACVQRGARLIPGGGLSTIARLDFMRQTQPTIVACTPSYALQMASVALEHGFPLAQLPVRRLLVAGEPGGSIPAVRERIEQLWDARVIDHCGATEIGPWGFGWSTGGGIHVIESSFIAELLPVPSMPDTNLRELVLTSLGRHGAPVIRYRTGDLVDAHRPPSGPCRFLWLDGGIVGRADDMVVVRGVNVFPSSIAAVVERFPAVMEYRVTICRRGQLDDLILDLECDDATAKAIVQQLDVAIGLRIETRLVAPGSLPRSDGKARRWLDKRESAVGR
ncbi:MAG: AMP-binding protein [Pirellulaceae bacterium]|nr:AMP-binding protein [Pirellulaceae bacterium]